MERKKMQQMVRKLKRHHKRFFRSHAGLNYKKRVKDNWRRERGIDNKKRRKEKHRGADVNVGWRNPRTIRHIHPSGYREVLIENINDLTKITEGCAGRIRATVGAKKRAEIIKRAKELHLPILGA